MFENIRNRLENNENNTNLRIFCENIENHENHWISRKSQSTSWNSLNLEISLVSHANLENLRILYEKNAKNENYRIRFENYENHGKIYNFICESGKSWK